MTNFVICVGCKKKANKWLQPTAKTVTCFAKKPAKQPPFFAAAEPGVIRLYENSLS